MQPNMKLFIIKLPHSRKQCTFTFKKEKKNQIQG